MSRTKSISSPPPGEAQMRVHFDVQNIWFQPEAHFADSERMP
jgi:hypothetical protein